MVLKKYWKCVQKLFLRFCFSGGVLFERGVVEQLLDQVHVTQQHPAATVPTTKLAVLTFGGNSTYNKASCAYIRRQQYQKKLAVLTSGGNSAYNKASCTYIRRQQYLQQT